MKIGIYIPYKTSLVSTLLYREREWSAPGLTEMEMMPLSAYRFATCRATITFP